tara:strand:- start:451 stop:612 length:162 start_codon:yes stop_codon:yes gene_type:complete
MDKKILAGSYRLKGDMINVCFATLKDVLPALTRFKNKTENNNIILGEWRKNKN